MIIRPAQGTDYLAIGNLHASAFGNRSTEALIVALLRHRHAFDLALSCPFLNTVPTHCIPTLPLDHILRNSPR